MVNIIVSSALALALALSSTQVAHALPQAPPSDASPSDSWSSSPSYTTSYSSTPSPYSSQYSSTTDYYATTTDSYSMGTPYYSSQPYYSSSYYPPPKETYPPTYTTPYSSIPSLYSSQYSSTTDYYSTTTESYSTGIPYYSSQPYYTSSSSYYLPPKETYPPTTSPYPPSPSKSDGKNPEPNMPSPLRATYDATFNNRADSLNNVACSNGPNGLVSRFPTLGDIPNFPFIGGAFDVVWNSPNCGGCWNITNPTTGSSVQITAIDTAGSGFNIAQEAFEKLNGGQIGQGVVDVVANKVAASVCGL